MGSLSRLSEGGEGRAAGVLLARMAGASGEAAGGEAPLSLTEASRLVQALSEDRGAGGRPTGAASAAAASSADASDEDDGSSSPPLADFVIDRTGDATLEG